MIKANQFFLKYVRITTEYCIFLGSFWVVFTLWLPNQLKQSFQDYGIWIALLGLILIGFYGIFGLYDDSQIKKIYDEGSLIFMSHIIVATLMFVVGIWVKIETNLNIYLMQAIGISLAITMLSLFVRRKIMLSLIRKGWYRTDVIVVGDSDLVSEYVKTVTNNQRFGHYIISTLYTENEDVLVDEYRKLEEIIQYHPSVSLVVLGLSMNQFSKLSTYIELVEKYGLKSSIIPDYQRYLPSKPAYDMIGNTMLIHSRTIPLDHIVNKSIKRIMDIILSMIALLIFLPLLLPVGLIIKLTSAGPLFFKQIRIGYNNQPFSMLKFRSMTLAKTEEAWSPVNEPRVTKIGKIIRKLSIDEFPQFLNVLKGEMSIIGPRPERPQFVKTFSEEIPKYNIKHRVKPGITGLAQIHGYRGDTSIIERVRYDLYYVENWTIQMDLYIMVRTALLGFVNKNE